MSPHVVVPELHLRYFWLIEIGDASFVWGSGQVSTKGWQIVSSDICKQRRVLSQPPEVKS